jgi:hypothetical protein
VAVVDPRSIGASSPKRLERGRGVDVAVWGAGSMYGVRGALEGHSLSPASVCAAAEGACTPLDAPYRQP